MAKTKTPSTNHRAQPSEKPQQDPPSPVQGDVAAALAAINESGFVGIAELIGHLAVRVNDLEAHVFDPDES